MKVYYLFCFLITLIISLFSSDTSNFSKQSFSSIVENITFQIDEEKVSEKVAPLSEAVNTSSLSAITEQTEHIEHKPDKYEIEAKDTEESETKSLETDDSEIKEAEIKEPEIEEPEIEEPVEIILDDAETPTVINISAATNNKQPDTSTENITALSTKDFTATPRTFEDLAPTSLMSFEEIVGDNGLYEIPSYMPEPGTYRIIVDLKYQVVMVYEKDNNGDYTVPVRYMICSTGADATQTPTGTFAMKDYRVRYAIFRNTDVYAQYWSLITGRIYFHSLLYSAKDASTYTKSSYNNLGHNVSHGCIRLTVPDARWIWYNIAPGTEVEVRKGSSKDKATKEIKEKLTLPKLPEKRITLTPGNIPYTDNWQIEDVPQEYKFINGHQ